MLHLQPRVHLHEIEVIRPEAVGHVGDELHGACTDIADRLGGPDRGIPHRTADLGRHAGRRRLLYHLLMPALQRAVALEEVDDIAVPVAEDLHLDVTRLRQIAFEKHRTVAEGGFGLPPCGLQRGAEILLPLDPAHAFAAAARPRLDQHRIADFPCPVGKKGCILLFAVVAGHDRYAGSFHESLGRVLETHGANCGRRRPDEYHACFCDSLREIGVLRQETIARMNGLCADASCRLNDRSARQIAFGGGRPPDPDRLVGERHVQRVSVSVGIDGDGADAEPSRGADDAAGDFTAIGNQELRKHTPLFQSIAPRPLRLP